MLISEMSIRNALELRKFMLLHIEKLTILIDMLAPERCKEEALSALEPVLCGAAAHLACARPQNHRLGAAACETLLSLPLTFPRAKSSRRPKEAS
jgi:hypothetical protein